MLDHAQHKAAVVLNVASPTTAGAYVMGFLPHTWGEWAALAAGLWAVIQIINFAYEKHKKTVKTKKRKKATPCK